MVPLGSGEPGRTLCTSLELTSIPDLTDKITRQDNQYYAAGGFGDVYRCQYTDNNSDVKEVAVKAFRFSFSVDGNRHDDGKTSRMIRRELGIWRRLNHRNIVPFFGITYGFGRQGSASLVSMWMPHGTLHTFLETHDDRLMVAHRLQLLLDIASGLHYLHSIPVIHGDLTSNNVLLDHNYNACLTDFGCATLVGELPEGLTYLKLSTVRPGTLRWAAPEHFSLDEEETKDTIKSDIYSFGNMALLVLSAKYPWSEVRADAAVMLRLSQGLKPGRPPTRPIDDRHWTLIERCWSSIPERPLTQELVALLQQCLGAYPPLQPWRALLNASITSSSPSSHPSNDELGNDVHTELEDDLQIHHLLSEDTPGPAECPSRKQDGAGNLYSFLSDQRDRSQHGNSSKVVSSTPSILTGVSSNGRQMISKWVCGELLGQGTYGCVYLAHNVSNGEVFAVKRVEKVDEDAQYLPNLKMEAEILNKLRHPHIVAYLGSEERETSLNVFLEYIPQSIEDHLLKHGRFNEEVIKSFTAQIFDGLTYLHANHIIHRNIESGNILVDSSGICKLSGFGNALCTAHDRTSWMPMHGTMFWTAPEVAKSHGGKRYGPKVDIWIAGCVLLKMWAGDNAWWDDDVIASVIKATGQRTFPSLPSDVILSDLAVEFKNRCFVLVPETRASATELLQHPYLTLPPDWVFMGFK